MKNKEKWRPKRFTRNAKGQIIGTYNHKIIGNAYEPVIRKYACGYLADIGCGDVPYYHFYKDNVTDNICVDWGNSTLATSFLDYEADLNAELPFLNTSVFDTVLCTDVLEHIHNPELLFSEMVRILKPGGYLILMVPFLYWIHEVPYDYHRYSHFKLKQFCDTHNLQVEKLDAYGGLPEVFFDLVHKGYSFNNFPFRKPFLFCWNALGSFLSRRKFIKKISDRSRQNFPMGYVLVAKKNPSLR